MEENQGVTSGALSWRGGGSDEPVYMSEGNPWTVDQASGPVANVQPAGSTCDGKTTATGIACDFAD
ncbi:hypothetical protein [Croceicoccus naphthovorans]|uniref:Uncharacterized protein n=1 Tax=Croceicoccus naphthovorans TaxID=1348774 RepID=A0A0G3XHZ7_9SPHN|nr:hypothetical protein [Croceicoccus naphthovorans]AKM10236.1 hypothetical protein AB433_10105 [Croceicoccus naphthovorans]MBB3990498.1 hypothetical protein [Croceicoccus naphthovorans]